MWGEGANVFGDNPHVPDYTGNESHFGTSNQISMWVVPVAVAGIWWGEVQTTAGRQDRRRVLHQRLSEVTGTFQPASEGELGGGLRTDPRGKPKRVAN